MSDIIIAQEQTPIAVSQRAAKQVEEFLSAGRRIEEQLTVYVQGLAAALDAPEGWQFSVQTMAFLPPATPPAKPSEGKSLDTESSESAT